MANDRKLLTADAKNLKAKVKAEMQRRAYSGSVSTYGGTAYDFSSQPTDGGAVLGEHLKKNLEPMQAVNGDGLPTYPGPLSKEHQDLMETKVSAWATRSITDRSASDCKSGCTGTCFSGCQTGCHTGCTSCTSCDGCSGCGSQCSSCTGCTGCSGCGSCGGACSNNCTSCTGCSSCSSCTGTCTVSCGNAGCSGACVSSCYNTCKGGCQNGCVTGCGGSCGGSCGNGCGGCGTNCSGVSKLN